MGTKVIFYLTEFSFKDYFLTLWVCDSILTLQNINVSGSKKFHTLLNGLSSSSGHSVIASFVRVNNLFSELLFVLYFIGLHSIAM